MNDIKVIAFYLPQFHTIPENDEAYGNGFTEWTNVKKATPLFEGHYQPKVPLNNEYYNLLDDGVMRKQAMLAKQYGIYGFCYYHYWFAGGKKLLEKPLEKMLKDKSIDIPFCLCWANENWTRKWDGGNNEIIVKQDYDDYRDLKNHVSYLVNYIKDDRYIRINGKPILLIYKPELIKNSKLYIKKLREEFKNYGIEISIGFQFPDAILFGNYEKYCDFYVEFEPTYVQKLKIIENRNWMERIIHNIYASEQFETIRRILNRKGIEPNLRKFDYDDAWNRILSHNVKSKKAVAGAFTDWDNTARKKNGIVYTNGGPASFAKYIREYFSIIKEKYHSEFLFINAWNEWAEGAYLEPDEKNGFSYLEAIRDANK